MQHSVVVSCVFVKLSLILARLCVFSFSLLENAAEKMAANSYVSIKGGRDPRID